MCTEQSHFRQCNRLLRGLEQLLLDRADGVVNMLKPRRQRQRQRQRGSRTVPPSQPRESGWMRASCSADTPRGKAHLILKHRRAQTKKPAHRNDTTVATACLAALSAPACVRVRPRWMRMNQIKDVERDRHKCAPPQIRSN